MPILTPKQKAQFREDGFCVLPGVIDAKTLTWLREQCAYFHGYMDAFMDGQKVDTYGITHRDRRYFYWAALSSKFAPASVPVRRVDGRDLP